MLIERKYDVQFVTPGFVGGADQSGEWRSPPFKALLRQWWRVVWWHTVKDPTLQALRKAEGDLFGWAADTEKKAKKSQVLLRLESWKQGSQTDQDFNKIRFPEIEHPEVKDRQGTPRRIAASLYLGYGPGHVRKRFRSLETSPGSCPWRKANPESPFPAG
jgi:CRISPR-associated protein Cmr1